MENITQENQVPSPQSKAFLDDVIQKMEQHDAKLQNLSDAELAQAIEEVDPTKTIVLSDGRKAVFRQAIGRDLIKAARVSEEPSEMVLALATQIMSIDGKGVILEDLLDMKLADVIAIQAKVTVQMGNAPSPAAST